MNVSIVIPTQNAEPWIRRQLDCLFSQTVEAEILVVDSGSTDATLRIVREYSNRLHLIQIPPERFDHGGTRNFAFRQCSGDYVFFLTQDALPIGAQYIETMLAPFEDGSVAAVIGRQIAYPDAPAYEKLIRSFNYPEEPKAWKAEDIERYGVKGYFTSDACSAYRRSAFEAVGGFDAPILTSEDMMIAAKLLRAGYKLVYLPEARVLHSHNYTLAGDFRKYVRIGYVMEKYRDRLTDARPTKEGLRLFRHVGAGLLKTHSPGDLTEFVTHAATRYIGFRVGKLQAVRKR